MAKWSRPISQDARHLKRGPIGPGLWEHNFYCCSHLVIKVRAAWTRSLDNYNRKWLLLRLLYTHKLTTHASKNWKTNPSCGELFLSPLQSQVRWNLSVAAQGGDREPCKGDVLSQMSRVIKIFRIFQHRESLLCVDIKATTEPRRRWGNWCDGARHTRHNRQWGERMTSHLSILTSPEQLSALKWGTGRGDLMEMYSGYSPLMGRGIFQYLCKLFLQFLSQTRI